MDVAVLLVGWGWTYAQMKAGWSEIEDLGYDICYLGDDLFPHPDVDEAVYDPWTLLPAIAATTKRMKIGSLVSPVGRRHPGLFAKMTTNIDVASGGRLIVGMGTGNAPEQQRSLNQPFPPPSERAEMLREELSILKSLWTQSRTTFEGKFYQVYDAINEPKPASRPHPEIVVGLRSKKFSARVAAEFADRVNLLGADDSRIVELINAISNHCADFGRGISDIIIGRPASVLFTDHPVDAGEIEEIVEARAGLIGVDPDELKAEHKRLLSYVGPPSGCAAALRSRTSDLGVKELVVCIDTIGRNSFERTMDGLRIFAREVLPELKRM